MPGPQLALDWEEGVFRGLLSLYARLFGDRDGAAASYVARLDVERPGLTVLAQILAREAVRISPARSVGGILGADLLLPSTIDLADTLEANRRLYVVRAAVSATMRRITRGRLPCAALTRPLESLRVAREAVALLEFELPAFAEAHHDAVTRTLARRPPPESLRGRERALENARQAALRGERPWDDPEIVARCAGSGSSPRTASPEVLIWGEWIPSPGDLAAVPAGAESGPPAEIATELAAPGVDELRLVEVDREEQEQAVLIHTFEKAEALDSYRGGARDFDGSDELAAHLEALDEVDLGALVRDDTATHALLRADLDLGLAIPDVADADALGVGIPYDEWDARRSRYRRRWCTVYPGKLTATRPEWAVDMRSRHRRLIRDLRQRLERHRARLEAVTRQLDGEDFDLTSVVDAQAEWRAGRSPDPRLYVQRRRLRRSFATTVLLDLSLSSDSWIDDRRVLDVSREAILVLGEVASALDDALQVLAFASHTRNRCRVWEIKGWNDPWPAAAARLGALEPQGYTRIGPALRHATAELLASDAEHRLLLLISDGKPTDYDRYEGRYGISDVRKAVQEAQRCGVTPHALAVESRARDTLPTQFGNGGWHILAKPDHLLRALTTVYGKLTAR